MQNYSSVAGRGLAGYARAGKKSSIQRHLHRLITYLCVFLTSVNPLFAYAGSVIPNGKTQTQVVRNGNVTSVTTATVKNNSGFNAFSEFDIDAGNTVNLYLPGQTDKLINLVYDKRSDIHGVLNSIKDGSIGGDIYFANPYGLLVGESGVINVGSFTATTPSHAWMERFFDEGSEPSALAVAELLNGNVPISASGLISIKGRINALDDIRLEAGNITLEGVAANGQRLQANDIDFTDLVNVQDFALAAGVRESNGVIEFVAANDIVIAGEVNADATASREAGSVKLRAAGDITFTDGATLSAQGQGENSAGGVIDIYADGTATLAVGAELNASAAQSGDGGFIELSATQRVHLAGGTLTAAAADGAAGQVYIDPEVVQIDGLELGSGGTNVEIEASEQVIISAGATVSSRSIADSNNAAAHLTDASIADSGDIIIRAPDIDIGQGARILANADSGFADGNISITNLYVIDVDAIDPTLFEIEGFSLGDILGDGNDLQGLINSLSLDETDVSRLLNVDKVADITLGSDGGTQVIVRGGNVNVHAYASQRFGFEKDALASVSVFNTQIEANTLTLLAESDTFLLPELFDNTVEIDGFTLDPNQVVENYIDSIGIPDSAFYVKTESTANTTISGAQTDINVSDQLNVDALARNSASPFSTGLVVGMEIIDADTNATLNIADQASLQAENIALNATVENKTAANSDVDGVKIPLVLSLAVNNIDAAATVNTASDVTLSADGIEIGASSEAEVETSARAVKLGGNGAVTALAISDVNAAATANASGMITADSLDVTASVEYDKNITSAEGGADGRPGLADKFNNLKNASSALVLSKALAPVTSKNEGIADKIFPQMKDGSFNIAGAIAIAETNNVASASLGDSANATVAGATQIDAEVADSVRIHANVKASSQGTAIGGAVTVADYINDAEAFVADNASLTTDTLDVAAKSAIAYPWDFDYRSIDTLFEKISDGFQSLIFTGSAINANKASDFGASASVNHINYQSDAEAYIGDATVTVTGGSESAVNVSASTETNLVTVSGKSPFSSAENAIGGSVNVVLAGGNVSAYIADGAVVNTQSAADELALSVDADGTLNVINIAESGGQADRIGIDGAVAYLEVDQTTEAYIGKQARVSADSVAVTSRTEQAMWSIAGGFVKSGAAGVGVSGAINDINVTTKSFIGDETDTTAPTGDTVDADMVNVDARADGVVDAISIAGALVSNSDKSGGDGIFAKYKAAKQKAGDKLDALTAQVNSARSNSSSDGSSESSEPSPKPSFGVGVSGSASVNDIVYNTSAAVKNAAVNTGTLAVNAINNVDIDAGSGSASFVKAKASGVNTAVAFAGTFAANDIDNTTEALIENAEVDADDVAVAALSGGEQLSVALGVALNSSPSAKNSASIAGSVSMSQNNNRTSAIVRNSELAGNNATDGAVEVVAYDKTELGVGGGSLYYGGRGGIGAAVSISEIANTTEAQIDNSTIFAFDDIVARALNASRIGTGAAMAGGGGQTNSLAGGFIFAEIGNTTQTLINNGSDIDANNTVSILASDIETDAALDAVIVSGDIGSASEFDYSGSDIDAEQDTGTSIVAVAGLVQVGKNNIGVSVVDNDINNTVDADVDNATISAGTQLTVDALSNTAITGLALGVGGGTGSLAANGSLVLADIENTVDASSQDADLTASTLAIKAQDKSSIDSLAGNITLSNKVALGASIAINEIRNTVSSLLSGGRVDVTNNVDVDANSEASIRNLAAAGGAAGNVSVGVSLSLNTIDNSVVSSLGAVAVDDAANISVDAQDDGSIASLAGSVNGAGTAAAGAAVSVNTINNAVTTFVGEITGLNALLGNLNSIAETTADIDSIAVAGGGAGTAAFNGSASTNFIANQTTALLQGNIASELDTLTVSANDDSSIESLAGSVGGAGTGAVGAAVAVNDIDNLTDAQILSSELEARVVSLSATTLSSIETLSVAGSGAGTFAVNGSVSTNFIDNVTNASADGLVYTQQGESTSIVASDTSTIEALAGSISGAGTAAVGAAVAVNEINGQTSAGAANSTLLNSGNTLVDADTDASITSLAVAGGGAGTAAIGGSASTNRIGNSTSASLDNTSITSTAGDVDVLSTDTSNIQSLAGSVQGSGTAAVGAAVAVNRIDNQTGADISGGTVDAANVAVAALGDSQIETIAVGASVSGQVAVAGSVAINLLGNNVDAHIDEGAQVTADGNVAVNADSEDDIDVLAGAVAVGVGAAGAGASVSVNEITSSTKAYIEGDTTSVSAQGNNTQGAATSNGLVAFDFGETIEAQAEAAENGEDGSGSTSAPYTKLDLASRQAADTQTRGVLVNATSQQNVDALGGTAGVGLYAGLAATANVNILGGETAAYIDQAQINTAAGANAAQEVAVVAQDQSFTNAFVGAIGGGAAGLGAAADTNLLSRKTESYINDTDQLNAQSDVNVRARADQGANSIAVGAAGGGVALAASGSVLLMESETNAYVKDSTLDVGNLFVDSWSKNQMSFYDFTAAISGAGSLAGAFGVAISDSRTSAYIEGNDTERTVIVTDGDVTVNAEAETNSDSKVVSFAASSGGFGVAGMAVVNIVTSETDAHVSDANIGSNGNEIDGLTVSAQDSIALEGFSGAAGVSATAGIGAGASVNVVKSAVTADIDNSSVWASQQVEVTALSEKSADAITATAGAGLSVGIGGAAAVNLFGSEVQGDSADELDSEGDGTLTAVNDFTTGDKTELLEGQSSESISSSEIAGLQMQTERDIKTVTTTPSAGLAQFRTDAGIGGTSDIHSASLTVSASDKTSVDATVGGIAAGAVGIGGAFALTEVKNNINADIGSGVLVDTGALSLAATAGKKDAASHVVDTTVFAGAAGLVGIGAAVGIASIENDIDATLGGNISASSVSVNAADSSSANMDALGAAAGAAAAGIVIADVDKRTSVQAAAAANAQISDANSVSITSSSSGSVKAKAQAAAGGILGAGAGADASASDSSVVSALVDVNAIINTPLAHVLVSANATPKVTAEALGAVVSLGASVGVSQTDASANTRVSATLAEDSVVNVDGLTLLAQQNNPASGFSADADSLGIGGGLLLGVNATSADAKNTSVISTLVDNDASITATGDVDIIARANGRQNAEVDAANGGIVAAGANRADALGNTRIISRIDDGADVFVSRNLETDPLSTLTVAAEGHSQNTARAVSGSGGVVSGVSSTARTTTLGNTEATVGSTATNPLYADNLVIDADHTATVNASVDSINASLAGASGARAINNVNSTVTAGIDAGSVIDAITMRIDAANRVIKNWLGVQNGNDATANVRSGSGGAIDAPAGTSTNTYALTTTIDIGDNAVINLEGEADTNGLTIDLFTSILSRDKSVLNSGGAVAIAQADSKTSAQIAGLIDIGSNAAITLDDGNIGIGARYDIDMEGRASADTYGLAGAPAGESFAVLNGSNDVTVGQDASIIADHGELVLAAGRNSQNQLSDTRLHTKVNLWNKTAIPIDTDPDARSITNVTSNLTIADNADVLASGDMTLAAQAGNVLLYAYGLGKDIYRETAGEIASGISNAFGGDDVSFDVTSSVETDANRSTITVDGNVETSIHRQQSIEIDYVIGELGGEFTDSTDENGVSTRYFLSSRDGILYQVVSTEDIDYQDIQYAISIAANIEERIETLRTLQSEYSQDSISFQAYESEITFLERRLVTLGLADDDTPSTLNAPDQSLRDVLQGLFNSQQAYYDEQIIELNNTTDELNNVNTGLMVFADRATAQATLDAELAKDMDDQNATLIANLNAEIAGYDGQISTNGWVLADLQADQPVLQMEQMDLQDLTMNLNDSLVATQLQIDNASDESISGPTADFLTLEDVRIDMGNIRLFADNLVGDGNIAAPGDARIRIDNDTPMHITMQDLFIDNLGGVITFNTYLVESLADVNLNNAGGTANFNSFITAEGSFPAVVPEIDVVSTYNPLNARYRNEFPNIAPDLRFGVTEEDRASIWNPRGLFRLRSEAGSVYFDFADVLAGTVDVEAKNGDFVQSYTDNFYHVGGNPEAIQDGGPVGAGIVANGDVFISARFLNINSLIQSGIESWNLDIGSASSIVFNSELSRLGLSVAQLDALGLSYLRYDADPDDGNTAMNDLQFGITFAEALYDTYGSNLFQLNPGSNNIGAVYDAETDQINVDGIEVSGGFIQLFGQIMNTSGTNTGILRVLDGYGQVDIDNDSGLEVVLNTISTGRGVEGVIDITDITGVDSNNDPVFANTVYTRNNGTVNVTTDRLAGVSTTTYTPDHNMRFVWTTGQDSTSTTRYHIQGTSLAGFIDLGTNNIDQYRVSGPTPVGQPRPIENGRYLEEFGTDTSQYASAVTAQFSNGAAVYTKVREWSDCNWWTVCIAQDTHLIIDRKQGTTTITKESVFASNPISIQFIGDEVGGQLNVNSNSNIILDGSLLNGAGNTDLISTGGIQQRAEGSFVKTGTMTLQAQNDIRGINETDTLKLLLSSELNASSAAGSVRLEQQEGNLVVGTVSAANTAQLVANDSLLAGAVNLVSANRVELDAIGGGLGSDTASVNIAAGFISGNPNADYGVKATASDDIYLVHQTSAGNADGHLLVDKIESRNGDVNLSVAGDIIDNNTDEFVDLEQWNALLDFWNSVAILEDSGDQAILTDAAFLALVDTGDYNAIFASSDYQSLSNNGKKQVQTLVAEGTRVTNSYQQYWQIRQQQADASEYDAGYSYMLSANERSTLEQQWTQEGIDPAEFDQRAMELADNKTAFYHELHAQVGEVNGGEYDSSFRYSLSDSERGELLDGASWSERQLGFALSPGLLKEVTDTNPIIKEANIIGRNVSVETNTGNIGNRTLQTEVSVNLDPALLTDAQRVALASAERGDIEFSNDLIRVIRGRPVNVDVIGTGGGLSATADNGYIYIGSEGDIVVDSLSAADEVRVKVDGNIVAGALAGGALAHIDSGDLVLESANGLIGAEDNRFITMVDGASSLIARADDGIYLQNVSGDLAVDTLFSYGLIDLLSDGGISEAFNNDFLNIFGGDINLSAMGDIGGAGNALDVELFPDGRLNADATGSVYLRNEIAPLAIGDISSGASVDLDADLTGVALYGDIVAADTFAINADDGLALFDDATISATNSAQFDLATNLFMEDGTRIESDGQIAIDAGGDATIANIESTSTLADAIRINTVGEMIDGGDSALDIIAFNGGANLFAEQGIGNDDSLEILVSRVDVIATDGDVDVTTDVDLDLNAVAEQGSVNAMSGGRITSTTGISAVGYANLDAADGIELDNLEVGLGGNFTAPDIDVRLTQHPDVNSPMTFSAQGHMDSNGMADDVNIVVDAPQSANFERLFTQRADISTGGTRIGIGEGMIGEIADLRNANTWINIDNTGYGAKARPDIQLMPNNRLFSFEVEADILRTNALLIKGRSEYFLLNPLAVDVDLFGDIQNTLQTIQDLDFDPAQYIEDYPERALQRRQPVLDLPEGFDPADVIQLDEDSVGAKDNEQAEPEDLIGRGESEQDEAADDMAALSMPMIDALADAFADVLANSRAAREPLADRL